MAEIEHVSTDVFTLFPATCSWNNSLHGKKKKTKTKNTNCNMLKSTSQSFAEIFVFYSGLKIHPSIGSTTVFALASAKIALEPTKLKSFKISAADAL